MRNITQELLKVNRGRLQGKYLGNYNTIIYKYPAIYNEFGELIFRDFCEIIKIAESKNMITNWQSKKCCKRFLH